jgi:hypothetical protein
MLPNIAQLSKDKPNAKLIYSLSLSYMSIQKHNNIGKANSGVN